MKQFLFQVELMAAANDHFRLRAAVNKSLFTFDPSVTTNTCEWEKLRNKETQTDSKMATPLAPMFPLGVTPRPPIRPAHRSLKHSHMTSALKHSHGL